MDIFTAPRNSQLELDKIYFWTATIRNWNALLSDDRFKKIVIDSMSNLSARELIEVYGFVIMPNHIHLIWKLNKMNGKELPNASFLKFTCSFIQEGTDA